MNESDAVVATALDYFEGWYDADLERVDRALHPELVKRSAAQAGDEDPSVTTKEAMLGFVRRGGGLKDRTEDRIEVEVMDIHHDIATAVVRSAQYREYIHLLRTPEGMADRQRVLAAHRSRGLAVRALGPDLKGYVESDGVRIHYEVTGDSGPTILLLPTWTIVHKRFWKAQVPYLSRHFRVLAYDGPGNGRSNRPARPGRLPPRRAGGPRPGGARRHRHRPRRGRRPLPGRRVGTAAGRRARRPGAGGDRRSARPLAISDGHSARVAAGNPAELPASRVPLVERDLKHWAKYDPAYWQEHHEDFLWFFFGMCFPEPHSTKQIEDCVSWGLDTSTSRCSPWRPRERAPGRQTIEEWCRAIARPVLAVHGSHDLISPPSRWPASGRADRRRERPARRAPGTSRSPATPCGSTC